MPIGVTTAIYSHTVADATGATRVSLSIGDYKSAVLQVTGFGTGTIIPEVSYDGGATWYTTSVVDPDTTSSIEAITAAAGDNVYNFDNIGGATHVGARCSAFTSGPLITRLSASMAG